MRKHIYEQVRSVGALRPGLTVEIPRRTVLRSDIGAFCGLTGDMNPIHLDDEAAAQAPAGQVVVPAFLTVSMLIGQWSQTRWLDPVLVVFTGMNDLRLRKPVLPGDSLGGHAQVAGITPTSDGIRSLLAVDFLASVRRDDTPGDIEVLTFTAQFLVRDHDLAPATSG